LRAGWFTKDIHPRLGFDTKELDMKEWKWSDREKALKAVEALAKLPADPGVEPTDRPQKLTKKIKKKRKD